MTAYTPPVTSRLPDAGTTIFSIMSALAQQHHAVNLGQGFPDFPCDQQLPAAVHRAMLDGYNQYPPMPGISALRQAIADKTQALYGRATDPDTEVTVTAGATQALLTALLAVVQPGDEVIVLEPCYDSYIPGIVMAGAVPVRVPLQPGTFAPDFARIQAAITPKTRALMLNTPHNPSGTVWSKTDMLRLQHLLSGTDVLVISDEVYEHMVYEGQAHASAARYPELAARSLIVSSFGKTFHVTGWKVGYVVAPPSLTAEFRKVHQFNVFTVNTPAQHGLAHFMQDDSHYLNLPAFYQRKRDLFATGLRQTRLRLLPCTGTYFQCASYAHLPGSEAQLGEAEFCQWLTQEVGVAAIPLSAFYADGYDQKIIRFCFAKRDETLQLALDKLARL